LGFGVSLKLFFILLLLFSWSFPTYFFKLFPFHIVPFQCWIFFENWKFVVLNSSLVFRFDFSPHTDVWNPIFLLPCSYRKHVSTWMHLKIKTSMFEQLISKPLKMDGIQISLLNVTCLNFMQNVVGWKSFKVYHTWQKGPSPYCGSFLPYILIPIKNNESKVVKIFKRTIF
jgi:hypothetical protein